MAGLSDIAQVDAGQGIAAFARGRGMAMQEDEAKMNRDLTVGKIVSQGAISADTPEKWSGFVSMLQKRFPQADLTPFQDFSTRQPMVDQLRNYASERSDDRADARSAQSNAIARERLAMDKAKAAAGGGTEYGLVPIYGVDAEGNTVAMQPSKAGGVRMIDGPNGVKIMGPGDKAADTAAGKARGAATFDLPNALAKADSAIALIDDLDKDPNRTWGTGVSAIGNVLPATPGFDYQQKVDQLKGKTFLEAYQTLKGGGAIATAEGDKAESAIARLNTKQTEAAFRQSLKDLRDVVVEGRKRALEMADRKPAGGQGAPPAGGGGQGNSAPRQAPDGNWYVPDPNRPGKYLKVQP